MLFVCFSLVVSFLLFAGSAFAQATAAASSTVTAIKSSPKKGKFDGSWNVTVGVLQGKDETSQQRTTTETDIEMKLNYRVNSMVKFDLRPQLAYQTGYQKSLSPEDAQQTSWSMKNAGVELTPNEFVTAQMGALNQRTYHSRLLVDDRAFPAVRASLQTSPKYTLQSGLRAQSAVAASNTTLGTGSTTTEKTPSFNSAGAFFNMDFSKFRWHQAGSYFEYNHLPTSVAYSSHFIGNSTTNDNGTNYQFEHAFKGLEYRSEMELQLGTSFVARLDGAIVKNNSAPSTKNQAYWVRVGTDFIFSDNFTLTPFYEYFRIEPDALVAIYGTSALQPNRVGYRAGVGMTIENLFRIYARAGQRDVLFINDPQSKENTVELVVETLDVAI